MDVMMQAVRVHQFGGPEVLVLESISRPKPAAGEVLLQVKAAGVGPWDAWIRAGRSALPQPLPLTVGSDVSGIIASLGPGVSQFAIGEEVFGVTNARFTGGYAEYAVASAAMLARKPATLSFLEAAAVPVVACTAWQMVFDRGQTDATTRILIHGAAGNVGGYAVQFARGVAREVIATALPDDMRYVQSLGADRVIDGLATRFDEVLSDVDVVLDTVGGKTQERSFSVLKRAGILVSSVSRPDPQKAAERLVRGVFFLVEVTSARLERIGQLFDTGKLIATVGDVLPLADFRTAHEMLDGKAHKRGKIVLAVDGVRPPFPGPVNAEE